VEGALEHEQKNPRTEPGHSITIEPGTLLHHITGITTAEVNTAHHQAAGLVPDGVIVSARSPDGIIEAIEYPSHPFCLGVQWHPEYHVSPIDEKILAAFVKACKA